MNISFNTKGRTTYARFRMSGQKEVHLGYRLADCIRMLKNTFRSRQLIEQDLATQEDLDYLIKRLEANMS